MKQVQWTARKALLLLAAAAVLSGCRAPSSVPAPKTVVEPPAQTPTTPVNPTVPTPTTPAPQPGGNNTQPGTTTGGKAVTVTANPTDIAVLVNKSIMLPANYKPSDLVEPKVPFIFKEQDEKRLMRKEAAEALERLFAGAKKDGVNLAGVSGYRSYQTQEGLFNYYVKTQGEELARKYSAEPGHSEHQTGLAMDVSGSTGACAADDCFADTPEANWLAKHAPEYGFIIRYPKGKEAITGYAYEPWHLRYVGMTLANAISSKGLTMEEYFSAKQ